MFLPATFKLFSACTAARNFIRSVRPESEVLIVGSLGITQKASHVEKVATLSCYRSWFSQQIVRLLVEKC